MFEAVAQPKGVQEFFGPGRGFRPHGTPRERIVPDHGSHHDVLQHVEFGHQVVRLEHKANRAVAVGLTLPAPHLGQTSSPPCNVATIWPVQISQLVEQGAFARPRRAQHAEPFAFLDLKVHAA